MIRYKAILSTKYPEIHRITIEKESDKSVWRKGWGVERKISDYHYYFNTLKEAKDHLFSCLEKEIKLCQERLESRFELQNKINNIKEKEI